MLQFCDQKKYHNWHFKISQNFLLQSINQVVTSLAETETIWLSEYEG